MKIIIFLSSLILLSCSIAFGDMQVCNNREIYENSADLVELNNINKIKVKNNFDFLLLDFSKLDSKYLERLEAPLGQNLLAAMNEIYKDMSGIKTLDDLKKSDRFTYIMEAKEEDTVGGSPEYRGTFRHNLTGLKIIAKVMTKYGRKDDLDEYYKYGNKWDVWCYTGENINVNNGTVELIYFELDLRLYAYETVKRFLSNAAISFQDKEKFITSIREIVGESMGWSSIENVFKGRVGKGGIIWNHGHLHQGNMLIKYIIVDKKICTEDIRIIDFTVFRKSRDSISILSWADLEGVDLIGHDLVGAFLDNANLRGADLSMANLKKAELENADLRMANLSKANLEEAGLCDTDLRMANLSKANLYDADLESANLRKADLRMANLSKANLEEASLCDADLFKANLKKAELEKADLRMANLSKANLEEASLCDADLESANLSKANFYGADLESANLRGSDLRMINLSKANLKEAILCDADLFKANLKKSKLEGADLRFADLRLIYFSYTCDWDKIILYKTKFSNIPKQLKDNTKYIIRKFKDYCLVNNRH